MATSTRISQAHAGVGSVSFTTCTLLSAQLGVKHHRVVAYRGTGPALNDLVGGQVDYMCDQIVNLVEQVKAEAIKAYAIATAERSPALPNVPTTKESGLPDYQVSAWNALFAPKGTPKEIVTKLNETLSKALDDPGTRKRLLDLGSVLPQGNERSPQALGDLVQSEVRAGRRSSRLPAQWVPSSKTIDAASGGVLIETPLHGQVAMAPPSTLAIFTGRPSWRITAMAMAANASLISIRSTSPSLKPARASRGPHI